MPAVPASLKKQGIECLDNSAADGMLVSADVLATPLTMLALCFEDEFCQFLASRAEQRKKVNNTGA